MSKEISKNNLSKNIWQDKKADEIPSTLFPDSFLFNKLLPRTQIIDIGCGIGNLAIFLAKMDCEVIGIDPSKNVVEQARYKAKCAGVSEKCTFTIASGNSIPAESFIFDTAIIQAVLTVIPTQKERIETLREVGRVLKPDGFIYIADFCQTWQHPAYRKRYINDVGITGEEGLFIVHDSSGNEIYRAKHFTNKEVAMMALSADLSIIAYKTLCVTTRSGNIIDGFQTIMKKEQRGLNEVG